MHRDQLVAEAKALMDLVANSTISMTDSVMESTKILGAQGSCLF